MKKEIQDKNIEQKVSGASKANRTKKRFKVASIVLAALVVFGVTYALINPASTQKAETFCGFEEHQHTAACYERTLICGLPEGEGHQHTDECYEEQQILTCTLPETDGHVHSDDCYETTGYLSCGLPEGEGHQHTDDCYENVRTLICENTEEDHMHTEECFINERLLICNQAEYEPHQHDESCWTYETVRICGQEECEPHHHDENCYTSEKVLICDQEECEAHQHVDECYTVNYENMICTLPEHQHTLACFSNPAADVETAAVWEQSFSSVTRTGNWREDVLAIARTQLGYQESDANYQVQEDGVSIKGYTRYGDWYGDTYGDWCAMFCSFCINYAKVDRSLMPLESGCTRWVDALSLLQLYHTAEEYSPRPGDLIFFDFDEYDPEHPEERKADHVGIIEEIVYERNTNIIRKIKTIEGNNSSKVSRFEYPADTKSILGYAEMVTNPELLQNELNAVPACDCGVDNPEHLEWHADSCSRKNYVLSLCESHNAVELADLYGAMPEDVQYFMLTSLTRRDLDKLEQLEALLLAKPIQRNASDGDTTVSVSGCFSVGTVAALETVSDEDVRLVEEYLAENVEIAEAPITAGAVDISLLQNGETFEPDESMSVTLGGIDLQGVSPENLLVKVYHIKETDAADVAGLEEARPEVEELQAMLLEDGSIVFETQGFSLFYYTVEFYHEDVIYTLDGYTSILLSELFEELKIDRSVSEVTGVFFSDSTLIQVDQEDGDWRLTTLGPFLSEEKLSIRFSDNTELILKVTDAYEPVGRDSYFSNPNTDNWSYNTRLKRVYNGAEWAYFYHTDTRTDATYTGGKRYKFANDAANTTSSHTFDTIEYRNAFEYTDQYNVKHTYNVCVKVTLNQVPNGTIRWDNLIYLNNDNGTPYLSIGHFALDNNNYNDVPFDITWEMWLEDPSLPVSEREPIKWAPFLAGSCYLGDREYVQVYSKDNTIYTNLPKTQNGQNVFTYDAHTSPYYEGWHNKWGWGASTDYDKPDKFAVGMATEDGIVTGKYVAKWERNWGCEFTASLYEAGGNLKVTKRVEGTNSAVNSNTEFHFRAGFIDPFNDYQWTSLGTLASNESERGYGVTDKNGGWVRGGKLGANGEFTLKDGETIEFYYLPPFFCNIDISEYTQNGTSQSKNYSYYGHIEETTGEVTTKSGTVYEAENFQDAEMGTQTIRFLRTAGATVTYVNTVGEGSYTPPPGAGFEEKAPDHQKTIDAFRDGDDNPDTDVDDLARAGSLTDAEIEDLYRLYLTLGPESSYAGLDILFVVDRSSSMANHGNGNDATDIAGHTHIWRRNALNSMLNGLGPNNGANYASSNAYENYNNYKKLESDGLLAMIYKLNSKDKIAVAYFNSGSGIELDWGTPNRADTANTAGSGTNYTAGLNIARTMFDSVAGDGNEKVLIFVSDGLPTQYTGSDGQAHPSFPSGNDPTVISETTKEINSFKADYCSDSDDPDNVTVYCISIGSEYSPQYLEALSSDGSYLTTVNFKDLIQILDSKITRLHGHYSNLIVSDTLSDYVDFYRTADTLDDEHLDLIVDMYDIYTESATVLYEDGALTTAGVSIIKSDGVHVDFDTKTVTVDFLPSYQEAGGIQYRVHFNVKTTQQAYDEYAENIAAEKTSGYMDGDTAVTGDDNTDYIGNGTSSLKPGFHSNEEATLTYRQALIYDTGTLKTEPYDDPVIQVQKDRLTVKKVWSDEATAHANDSVEVKVYSKALPADYSASDEITEDERTGGTLVTTVTLNAANNWTRTLEDLPRGYYYYIVETPLTSLSSNYVPTYAPLAVASPHSKAGSANFTLNLTNTKKVNYLVLKKTDMLGNALPGAGFKLYSDAQHTTEVHAGELTLSGTDGIFTPENLLLENGTYYLVETTTPDGYNTLTSDIRLVVTKDGITAYQGETALTVSSQTSTDGLTSTYTLAIANSTGYELPKTGGIGTTIFYVVGGILIVGAAVLLITKKRMRK